MATPDEPLSLTRDDAGLRQPPRLSWLGLVGFGLVLALLAVALVQARQFSLLRLALQSGNDFGVLTIFETETDYLRLRDQFANAKLVHPFGSRVERRKTGFRLRGNSFAQHFVFGVNHLQASRASTHFAEDAQRPPAFQILLLRAGEVEKT